MAKLADLLQQFQSVNVPVLLRPYHESNSPGFWWVNMTTPDYPKRLWRQLRTYLEGTRHLTNIVWLWSAAYHTTYWPPVAEFYPGDDVADVVGVDIRPTNLGIEPPFATAWNSLKTMAPSKPIALTEVSRLPLAQELQQRQWAYVVPFGITDLTKNDINTTQEICSFYAR